MIQINRRWCCPHASQIYCQTLQTVLLCNLFQCLWAEALTSRLNHICACSNHSRKLQRGEKIKLNCVNTRIWYFSTWKLGAEFEYEVRFVKFYNFNPTFFLLGYNQRTIRLKISSTDWFLNSSDLSIYFWWIWKQFCSTLSSPSSGQTSYSQKVWPDNKSDWCILPNNVGFTITMK